MASKGRLIPGNTKVSILGMLESVKVLEHHFGQKWLPLKDKMTCWRLVRHSESKSP